MKIKGKVKEVGQRLDSIMPGELFMFPDYRFDIYMRLQDGYQSESQLDVDKCSVVLLKTGVVTAFDRVCLVQPVSGYLQITNGADEING